MYDSKPLLHASRSRPQQQPPRVMDRQQQQSSGSREFQPKQPQTGDTTGKGRERQP